MMRFAPPQRTQRTQRGGSAIASVFSVSSMVVLFAIGVSADVVHTNGERLQGPLSVAPGEVRIGEKRIPLDQVVMLVRQTPGRTISAPHALRMRSGEVWHVDLVRVLAKKARFVSPLLGEKEVDLAAIAAIDFVLRPEVHAAAANTLYRDEGEPIPGSIIWIDPTRIAVESPLGTLTLPRDGLLRYVFTPEAPAADGDELTLIDGTLMRGKARAGADGFELEHAMLGMVHIPMAAVRSVRRHGIAQYVDQLNVVQKDLLGAGEAQFVARGEAGETHQPFVNRFTLGPDASASMDVVQAGTLRMAIGPVRGARSAVSVKIVAAGKALWEKTIAPGDLPAEVGVNVPAGRVSVEIRPAGQLRFPAGAALSDPRIEAGP